MSDSMLYQKLFKVMKAIPELVKTGRMAENGETQFAYHEADSIREAFRAQLLKHRLLLMPVNVSPAQWVNPTSSGGRFNYSQQLITFRFIDVDSRDFLDVQAVGWGGDALDKAAPKAAIQALKYLLTNTFFVKGIELDGDSPEEQIAGREANRQHQNFEGIPDAIHCGEASEPFWLLLDGMRMFATAPRMKSVLKKRSKLDPFAYGIAKIRTYMGTVGDGKNPQCIIDKIEFLETKQNESASASISDFGEESVLNSSDESGKQSRRGNGAL